MIRKLILTLLLLAPASVFAQTAAIQGYCDKGGTKTVTQGLNSTNYSQGDNPHCQITVYLTGTQTKATLTADKDGTPLPNPFTAGAVGSLLPGKWIFVLWRAGQCSWLHDDWLQASKCSSQHFNYSTAQIAWLADSAGVVNR